MKTKYQWIVKKLILKQKIVCEFEHQALLEIGNDILNGKFHIILEKNELAVAEVV